MTYKRMNLIKGQSERSFQKSYTTSTCFTPYPKYPSIDISNGIGDHEAAVRFFAALQKTCRNSKLEGK